MTAPTASPTWGKTTTNMRLILSLLLAVACHGQGLFRAQNVSASGPGTWTLTQVHSAGYLDGTSDLQCSGTSCTLGGLSSLGAGHVGVIVFAGGNWNGA